MNNYSVYMHKNHENGLIYIGQTNNIQRRWRNSGVEYKHEHHAIGEAIIKYGWDAFEHVVLESGLSKEEANDREKYYITLYHSNEPDKGYNVADGGDAGHLYRKGEHPRGMLGKHHSEEKKRQQAELMRRLNAEGKCGAVWKNGHPRGMLGKHHTEAFKQRLREIPSGQHPSAKRVKIKYRDGQEFEYDCLKYLAEATKVEKTTLIKIIKSGKPYSISPHCHSNLDNLKKIDGAVILYL